jgi:serine/threonine protein kinase
MTRGSARRPSDRFGWAGSVLDGKFRIDEAVGEGGFGVVYAGHHLGFDEPVAVKCLKVDSTDVTPGQRERFLKNFIGEGKILYRLSATCPSIVRAIDVGAAVSPRGSWTPYLVLEWIRGITLEDDLAERRERGMRGRTLAEAIDLLEPAARALEAAHEQDVVHRDVKPANLILADVRGRKTLKVLDFGVAKVMSTATARRQANTGVSFQAFTLPYAAPEQLDSGRGGTGPWTDVYALALVFVEVIAGRRAYRGNDAPGVYLEAVDEQRRPTLRALGLEVPDEVERVLSRALAVDPRNRFTTAGEFWAALSAATGGAPAVEQGRLTPGTTVNDEPPDTVQLTARDSTEIVESPRTVPLPMTSTPVPATRMAAPVMDVSAWQTAPASVPRRRPGVGCVIAISLAAFILLAAAAVVAAFVLAPDYMQELLNGWS